MDRKYEDMVSIIVPMFNSESYISKTIDSVLNQTYKDFELILVDDCSKDNTGQVVNEYVKRYKNVRYICLEHNSGAAVARNVGLKDAKGRFIAFLDSDDIWDSKKLEKQLSFMKENKYSFTFSSYDIINEAGKSIGGKIDIKSKITYKDLLTKTMIATPTVIIDRDRVGNITMPLRRTGQDYAFWLLLLRTNDAYGIDEVLVHVCKRKNSLSKRKLQNIKDVWEVQTVNEQIKKRYAVVNVFRYCIYALKKYCNEK